MTENEHTENTDTGSAATGGAARSGEAVLVVDGLTVIGRPSDVEIISGVSITVKRGEILGLVGESGSGKTTLGLSLLAHCKRATEITGGQVRVGGQDLAGLDEKGVRRLRGRAVAYIPQSPASALNPALRLGVQLREALHDDSLSEQDVLGRVARSCARWRCPTTTPSCAVTRTSCPAVSSSGWRSRWRSWAVRR